LRSPDANAATARDHSMSGMMVLREMSVECSAKIAMTALHSGLVTMGLLPNHDLARRHFS
jgi:hypothetical protein